MHHRPATFAPTLAILSLAGLSFAGTPADRFTAIAALDATLYESPTGALANGAGSGFFAGVNNQGLRRRGLLAFDLEPLAALLGGAPVEIHTVTLELNLSQGGGDPTMLSIHRTTAAWGEGTSEAPGNGGAGAAATPGSATWLHAFWPDAFWASPGGDFASTASGVFALGGNGAYQFSSGGLRDDLLAWLADPASNFGWTLVGDESTVGTARRFDSRFHPEPAGRPRLVIDYTVIPAPAAVSMLLLAPGLAGRRRR